jgi:DNA repair protein RecO (recombination protein O)
MHHIYHTEGIILGSKNYGEAGKYYSIFTRDLGMINASAQGIRKISSKLRFVLQDFSYVKIDLVRGKDFWRITSASKTNKLERVLKSSFNVEIFANVGRLLKRLLTGESPNQILFTDLLNGLLFLEKSKDINESQNVEIIIVLRILNNLGYIGSDEMLKNITKSPYEDNLIFEASRSRIKILSEINKALHETHL